MYKTKLGHVRLKVADLDSAVEFYTRFLHLQVTERVSDDFAFLSGNDSHHVIALSTCDPSWPPAAPESRGVHHIAFEVPGKRSFARAFEALNQAGIQTMLVNNGISWAIYFEDPDCNQLEIYCDMRHEPDGQEKWGGTRQPLQTEEILAVLTAPEPYVVPDPSRP